MLRLDGFSPLVLSGEPGHCCVCGRGTFRSLCRICRLQYANDDGSSPPWLMAIQREAQRLNKAHVTALRRGFSLLPFDDNAGALVVPDLDDEPRTVAPFPVVADDDLPRLRLYRNGVQLSMHEFICVLDAVLAWPPPGTTYGVEHRSALVDLYERVYP